MAVKNQATQNEATASRFFTALSQAIISHLESEGSKGQTIETCQHILMLAPLMKVICQYVGTAEVVCCHADLLFPFVHR